MPSQIPLGLANISETLAESDRIKRRRDAEAKRLESQQFYDGLNQRLDKLLTPPSADGWRLPKAGVSVATENDPDLLPKPPITANGVGGPQVELSLQEQIAAERARRAQGATSANPAENLQAAVAAERARRKAAAEAAPEQPVQQYVPESGNWTDRFMPSVSDKPIGSAGILPADKVPNFDLSDLGPMSALKFPQAFSERTQASAVMPQGLVLEERDIPDGAQAFMANAYNSATFGQGDKLRGAVAAALGGDYDQTVKDSRDWIAETREREPGWSVAGDMAGFVAPGGLIAKGVGTMTKGGVMAAQRLSPTLGFLAKTGQAAGIGGVLGGAYGGTVGADTEAMQQGLPSPELFSPERGQAAQDFATTGALLGGVMPAAGIVLRPVGNAAGGVIARAIEPFSPGSIAAHNTRIGADAARRTLERSGILTVEDLLKRAAKYGDKPVVTGELGQDSLNSLVALVRAKGTTGDKAMAVLEDRVAGMPGRMLRDIADETDMNPEEVLGSIEDMVKASRARAAPYYDASEATPFAETPELERIARAPAIQRVLESARGRVENQAIPAVGSTYAPPNAKVGPGGVIADSYWNTVGEMSGRSAMPPLKHWDEVKQLLDEEITKRIANQQGIEDVQAIRDALVRELDTISAEGADYAARVAGNNTQLTSPRASPYAKAREVGGDAPRIRAGVRSGERALSGTQSVEAIAREVAQLSGSQLTAYQMGVIRKMATDVENGLLSPKRIKSHAFQAKLNEVFGGPAASGLTRKFGVEAELATKGARWNPNIGAVTSQAQLGMPTRGADEAVALGASALRGDKFSAALQLFNMLRRRGYSENQRNALGDILLASPDDAAKALFPGQTPKPGSVPPPIPPAGRVRENPPGGTPQTGGGGASAAMAPLIRDAAGGVVGATAGAMTTPEGEDPVTRALMWGGAGALGTRIGATWADNIPLNAAQTNSFIPPPSRGLPWVRSMQKAGFDDSEITLAQRYMQDRFAGRAPEQIAERLGVPMESLAGRVQDIQRRLDDAGIGVELQAGRIADDLRPNRVKPADRAPPVSRDIMTPKDLIIGYNDGDSALNIGLDINLPDGANMAGVVKVAQSRLREQARQAKASGNLHTLSKDWGVSTDEIEKFIAGRPKPNAGGYQQSVERIVSLMEKAEKLGNPMRPVDVAQRLGMSRGSVAAMLSQARRGAKPLPAELQARVQALKIAKGRPIELAAQSPPEVGGGVLGGGVGFAMPVDANNDGVVDGNERLASIAVGAGGGVVAGRFSRGRRIDPTKQGSFGGSLARRAVERKVPTFVEDATDENLQQIQLDMIGRGEVPPVFKTFRLPDGRIVAWNGDESRGGMNHAQAREALGLGNARLEHGQSWLGGPPLSKTNWYDVSGEGPAPRSVERIVKDGMRQGREPSDALQDSYPHEVERDLRGIGAMGPGYSVADYPIRRALAVSKDNVKDAHSVSWKTSGGSEARVSFGSYAGSGGDPNVEIVDFRINGKTSNRDGSNRLSTGEATDAFQKALAVLERNVIERNREMYVFDGATSVHNRLYANAFQRLGAPQGYVAVLDRQHGNFALIKQARYDADVQAGRIDPNDFTVIASKRGSKEVPEWRRRSGQFALPIGGGVGFASAMGSQRTDEPRPQ